jgi:predicted N-formylglutamate amidohydrolase
MRPFDAVVVTCEHASARVPPRYASLFRGAARVLASHRGHDAGALAAARRFARRFDAPLHVGRVTRLLVDLNRSLHHRNLLSAYSRALSAAERRRLVARYWEPYRGAATADIARRIDAGKSVLHLSVHSFTPVWDGAPRAADVGLLYDPSRKRERALCAAWRTGLREACPDLRVRRNYPYRGRSDGFVTALRLRFPQRAYAGIEIEISQGLLVRGTPPRPLLDALPATLAPFVRSG